MHGLSVWRHEFVVCVCHVSPMGVCIIIIIIFMMRGTLAALLERPQDTELRREARQGRYMATVFAQAALPCRMGGLALHACTA